MFTELLPLLAKHSLILTVGIVKEGAIRVTVTPRPSGKDAPKEISQPFAVEGTAAELDAELAKAISEYASHLLTLEAGLAEVKANMDAALAEAKQEADKKVAEAKAKNKGTGSKPAVAKPAVPEAPTVDATPSLFDAPAPAPAIVETPAPATPVDGGDGDDGGDDDGDHEDEDISDDSDTSEDSSKLPKYSNVSPISTSAPHVAAATQTSTDLFSIEQEILQEVFDGSQNNLVAA